jgi:hypothetical protein
MNGEGVATGRTRPALPRVGDYLRAVLDLGRRSLRPALPALAFLYFYRVGMGVYMALSNYTYPVGPEAMASVLPMLIVMVGFLPMLLLIYTPFLPLQDEILQGGSISFLPAMRRALESAWTLTLSGIVQVFVFFLPIVILGIFAGLLMPEARAAGWGAADPSRVLLFLFVLMAGLAWAIVVGVLLMFATPAVVLDGEGPVQSLKTSVRLVLSRRGGVVGRLLAFAFLATVLHIVATMPAQILTTVERISGVTSSPLKIAAVIWTSAIDTLFFPFWVAALMVLYRTLAPRVTPAPAGEPVTLDDEYRPASAANAPFE